MTQVDIYKNVLEALFFTAATGGKTSEYKT